MSEDVSKARSEGAAAEVVPFGTKRVIDGQERVHYYGYWVKTYQVPADTLGTKKRLIEALTRRLFNHVEHGVNVPGYRLNEARVAYNEETDLEKRRVKGAMLAGAMFNRATDIFTKLVELQAAGVEIASDNALMRECGRCLQEALELGKTVFHRSGEEGIDELWGEPFKAFSIPVEAFYESRYIKIAQAMRDIDAITHHLIETFSNDAMFEGIIPVIERFAHTAKIKTETLRTDAEIFDVWSNFAVAGEHLRNFQPHLPELPSELQQRQAEHGVRLARQVRGLVCDITRARVSMPKSSDDILARCRNYRAAYPCMAQIIKPFKPIKLG
ncbi:hypothetical protein [Uliginosibacterium sediminicola]|uniref:Uncharacterized protein n=1 Tax=Uliginosibacterium sediminicola TaxID=2024550 RepID=A0ABU9Z3F2_9RHOO